MSPRLKAFLVAVPVFMLGGIVYYVPKIDTRSADLVDAGVRADCNVRRVACTMRLDGSYEERDFLWANCPNADGGRPERIIPRVVARAALDYGLHDLEGQCHDLGPAVGAFGGAPAQRAPSCACSPWPDAGDCRRGDGGLPYRATTMEPGQWAGADCLRTICRPLLGVSSMPAGCGP